MTSEQADRLASQQERRSPVPILSSFTPFGLLAFSGRPSHAASIHRAMQPGVAEVFSLAEGTTILTQGALDVAPDAAGCWVHALDGRLGAPHGIATLNDQGRLAYEQWPAGERIMPLDADDVLVWRMDAEAVGVVSNRGSAGASLDAGLIVRPGVRQGWEGLFGSCVRFPGDAGAYLSGAAGQLIQGSKLSVSCWLRLWGYSATDLGLVFGKRTAAAEPSPTGSAAVFAFALLTSAVTPGAWQVSLTTANGAAGLSSPPSCPLLLGSWALIAFTYDGAALRASFNGASAGVATAATGDIAYGAGDGPYVVGSMAAASTAFQAPLLGDVAEVRVARVVRSDGYYREMFRRGVGTWKV